MISDHLYLLMKCAVAKQWVKITTKGGKYITKVETINFVTETVVCSTARIKLKNILHVEIMELK